MATGIPNTEILFDLEALAGLQNRLPPDVAKNIPTGPGGFMQNLRNVVTQQPQLGPDDFGSYVIPASDPTYRSGFDYARSIAGGMPMEQVIAPGVSYSPEQPGGYTQEQLNIPRDVEKLTPPAITYETPDDPTYFGTGIGGVNIPVDRKQIPFRNITGGTRDIRDVPPLENLLNIGKLFDGGFDKDAIDKIVQERIAESMPTFEQPDLSQFVTKQDIPSFIPEIPTGRDFSIDREALRKELMEDITGSINIPDISGLARLEDIPQPPSIDREALIRDITSGIDIPKPPSIDRQGLIEDIRSGIELPTYQAPDLSGFARLEDIPQIPAFDPKDYREDFLSIAREGIDIPQYQAPDLSGFARLEDIPSFDPGVLKQDILMSLPQTQVPDVSQFVTQEDIQKAIAGIDMPAYQAPDLSAYDTRIAELEQQLAGLQTPTGGRFSISQPAPRGLF
jgi:hypothetical protein